MLVRRNERLHALAAPILSSTLQLRGRHGLTLLAITLLIWALEAGVWMSVGAAAGFPMNPIEGCYLVALASVFALIPSGPGYAGTQDAAAITGILALGGTALAGRHLPDPRALRARGADHARRASACWPRATAACGGLRARAMRRRGCGARSAYAVLVARGALAAAPDRARRPAVPPRREPGRLLLLALLRRRATTRTSRSCTGRCASTSPRPMYLLFGDSRLHRPARAGADGHADGARSPTSCARQLGRRRRVHRRRRARLRARPTSTTAASRARTSTSPASRSRCSPSRSASSTGRAATSRR